MRRVWLGAAEASGDALGARLARVLRQRHPDVDLRGLPGPRMRQAGVVPTGPGLEGVVGLAEAALQVPRALARLRSWTRQIEAFQPDAVVTVDSPSLLLRLGRRVRATVPVLHWVAPQVWAWRPGRARRVAACADTLCCLLPFEPAWFRGLSLDVRFTGHPAASPRPSWAADGPVVLLPGSRREEVRRLWPVLRDAAAAIGRRRPGTRFRVARAPTVDPGWLGGLNAEVGEGMDALEGAAAALVCSGTASLEVAAHGVPQVVAYAMSPVSWEIGRRLVQVEHVALPNLLAGRELVPEHLQHLDSEALAADLLPLLGLAGEAQRRALGPILESLRPEGAVDRVADALEDLLSRRARRASPRGRGPSA